MSKPRTIEPGTVDVYYREDLDRLLFVYEYLDGIGVRCHENFKSDLNLQEHQQYEWEHFFGWYKKIGTLNLEG